MWSAKIIAECFIFHIGTERHTHILCTHICKELGRPAYPRFKFLLELYYISLYLNKCKDCTCSPAQHHFEQFNTGPSKSFREHNLIYKNALIGWIVFLQLTLVKLIWSSICYKFCNVRSPNLKILHPSLHICLCMHEERVGRQYAWLYLCCWCRYRNQAFGNMGLDVGLFKLEPWMRYWVQCAYWYTHAFCSDSSCFVLFFAQYRFDSVTSKLVSHLFSLNWYIFILFSCWCDEGPNSLYVEAVYTYLEKEENWLQGSSFSFIKSSMVRYFCLIT